jgi:hypothetical protein
VGLGRIWGRLSYPILFFWGWAKKLLTNNELGCKIHKRQKGWEDTSKGVTGKSVALRPQDPDQACESLYFLSPFLLDKSQDNLV